MPRRLRFFAACLPAVIAVVSGCAHRHHAPVGGARPSSRVQTAAEELPAVERGTIEVATAADAGEMPAIDSVAVPRTYVALTAAECQRLAAQHSALGNLLDGRRRAVCCRCQSSKQNAACCVVTTLLDAAAREARNKNAADALRLYYGLAEVEAGLDTIAESDPLAAGLVAKTDEMRAAGLALTFDQSEFQRQQTALISRRADLEIKRDKLNTQLRALLGYTSTPADPYFWPSDRLEYSATQYDAEAEVEYGLATRAQLVGLRRLPNCGCPETADLLSVFTGETHGALKLFLALGNLDLLHRDDCCDPCALQRQLTRLGRSREQQVAGEIRTAVFAIDTRRRQVDWADEQVASWELRLNALQEKRTVDEATFIDLGAAKLKLLEAKQAVVAAVLEIKRAEIDLLEQQGALEAESGR